MSDKAAPNNKTIKINVPVLARVEGEGALDIAIKDQKIQHLALRIFEPPRLFEKLLQGRLYYEIPDMVARICGICPVAYQMSAVLAIESVFQTQVSDWVRDMRRVYYCGEWIESHSLHIHLLAAPDFLGYSSAPEMAKDFPDEVRRGLKLQAIGNQLIRLFGARSVNPIGVKVGGFSHAPSVAEVKAIAKQLLEAKKWAAELIKWLATLTIPQRTQSINLVCMSEDQLYPMMGTEILLHDGRAISIQDFDQHFREHQEPHSTALHCLLDGQAYLVGPLARINRHFSQLQPEVLAVLEANNVSFPSHNSYDSLLARAAEIYNAILESLHLLEKYSAPKKPYTEPQPRAGIAYGCTEAPRGMLWHRYEFDHQGKVVQARIVPPTSQNQAQMEKDIRESLEQHGLDNDNRALRQVAEQVIRNYDPCISCATHFLKLSVNRLS